MTVTPSALIHYLRQAPDFSHPGNAGLSALEVASKGHGLPYSSQSGEPFPFYRDFIRLLSKVSLDAVLLQPAKFPGGQVRYAEGLGGSKRLGRIVSRHQY